MSAGALVAVPDLQSEGLARLVSERAGYMVIRFLVSGAEMTQESRNVLRHVLLPGTRVRVRAAEGEQDATVLPAQVAKDTGTGLLVYRVARAAGGEALAREDSITAVLPARDAEEQLLTVGFHDLRPVPTGRATGKVLQEPWGPLAFAAREELLAWRDAAWTRTAGVVGLAGARVIPLPHQLLAARTALTDRQIRFLLADEVGLGKTIEAGLVVQSLLAMKPDLRVLVVAPGALVSQWFLELYVKFGGRSFTMLDAERLRSWQGNPWTDQQFVIASARAVEDLDNKAALQLATSKWDVLVVDECHRMQPGGLLYKRIAVLSKATPNVLLLSATPARSHPTAYLALLHLLTPQVWPLDAGEAFAQRLQAHGTVVDLLARTDAATAGFPALAREWTALLGADTVLQGLAEALAREATPTARDRLCAYVREHHQLDRRIIRRRRATLARLSAASGIKPIPLGTRSGERVPYAPDKTELAARTALAAYVGALLAAHAPTGELPPRLAHWLLTLLLAGGSHPLVLDRLLTMRATVLEDPGEFASYRARAVKGESTAHVLRHDLSEGEASTQVAISAASFADPAIETTALDALREAVDAWRRASAARGSARLRALVARIERFWGHSPQEKILVFTAHSLAVAPLAEALQKAFGEDAVATFGAHQDTPQREEAVRRFREDDGCALMVSDPLGGEGRNFQFVSVVAHHDLPWSVAAVEQRIGRVDRIGRDGDVPSWVIAPDDRDALDAAWADALERATGVFERPSSGLEFVLDAVEGRALTAALRLRDGAPALAAGVRAELAELERMVAAERAALDQREDEAFRDDAAAFAAAAALGDRVAAAPAPVDAVLRWVRGMGGSTKKEDEAPQAVRLRTRLHDQPVRGVFDRDRALAHPDLAFFALGQGLVDRLVADAVAADWCRASAWRRKPGPGCEKWDGVRGALELVLDLTPVMAAGLRVDVLRRLFVVAPPRRRVAWARCGDGALETDAAVVAHLEPSFDGRHRGDAAISATGNREAWTRPFVAGQSAKIGEWQDGVRRAAAGLRTHARALSDEERTRTLTTLRAHLDPQLAAIRATAAAVAARLGERHADAVRARQEAEDEQRQHDALIAAVEGAQMEVVSLAYVVVT